MRCHKRQSFREPRRAALQGLGRMAELKSKSGPMLHPALAIRGEGLHCERILCYVEFEGVPSRIK
jgi:hypothetical protein